MNAFIKIGAVAAVVLIAVVVGTRFLPGDASVGGPAETSSPAPSATPSSPAPSATAGLRGPTGSPSPVTGQFTFDADR